MVFSTAVHHVWVKFDVDRTPVSLLRNSCRVPRREAVEEERFSPYTDGSWQTRRT
jgi:hypothetical protein